tara:strand:+ start:471 stop:749 length:279 start_codon:yes stop_codon:yes gene_type:complete
MKNFTGFRWWDQNNPAYKESCKKQAIKETIINTIEYNYFIKKNNKMTIKTVIQKLAQLRETDKSIDLSNDYFRLKTIPNETLKNHLIKKYKL